jgi:type IX secretion system PorP/SprF family membrane protein
MVQRFILIFLSLLAAHAVTGQYYQYSQYNYTAQRINPALVATSNWASVATLFRNQDTGGDFKLKSAILSASYPMLSKRTGRRWSGIGISLTDDRAGGIFSTQEASLSYAVNVFIDKFRTITLGFKGLYQQRKINLDGLFTGSQYIPERGFDQSLSNGENLQFLRTDFFTFSTGLHWQQVDKKGDRQAYVGFSFFDLNKPAESFLSNENRLSSTMIVSGGVIVYKRDNISVMPELLLTTTAGNHVMNIGAVTSYRLSEIKNKEVSRLDLISKYVLGRTGIVGIQLHRKNISIGCSYDFPVFKVNPGNTGAVEVGVELRRLVEPRYRRTVASRRKSVPKKKPVMPAAAERITKVPVRQDSVKAKVTQKDLKTTLKQKQDSVMATAEAGTVRHEPLVIEKILLHFNFEFNSSELDAASKQYLDDLTAALTENEHLRIKLTGHTDNVGSARFNQRLSLYRADAIKEYLTGKGIDAGRIDTDGRGLSEPLNENNTEEERARNRRVELLIFYEE